MRQAIRAMVYSIAISILFACAGKVNTNPESGFLGSGAYRSRSISDAGGNGYQLELKPGGQFVMKTFAKGCLVGENSGLWHSSTEYLDLTVKNLRHREGCGAPWTISSGNDLIACPIRKTSNRSFQMIHEEINQGTQWTEWSMALNRSFGESSTDMAGAEPMEKNLSASLGEKPASIP